MGKADCTGVMRGSMGRPQSPLLNSTALRGCSGRRAVIGALGEAGLPQNAQPHLAAPLPGVGATAVCPPHEEVGPRGPQLTRRGTHGTLVRAPVSKEDAHPS